MDSSNKINLEKYDGYFVEAPTLRPGETEEFLHLYRDKVKYNPIKPLTEEEMKINEWMTQVFPDPEVKRFYYEYLQRSLLDTKEEKLIFLDGTKTVSWNELKTKLVSEDDEDSMPQLEEITSFRVVPTYEELEQMKYKQMRRISEMEKRPQRKLSIIHEILHAKFRHIAFHTYEELEDYGDILLESYKEKYTYEELKWYVDQLSKIVEYKPIDYKSLSAIISYSIKCCYVHPVTFQMVFEDLVINDIFNFITWDSLAFNPEDTVLEIFNQKTGNNDRHGGSCGYKNIPIEEFEYIIENEDGITIRDLTEAVYRMKGSKYDTVYEMFRKIKVREQDENKIIVEAIFDYSC